MTKEFEKKEITLEEKTLERLLKARRADENLSDVINRLAETKVQALQQRGEREIVTSDGRKIFVRIEQTKCAGAESCVQVAPTVFSLDVRQLGWGRKGDKPLEMKEVAERTVDSETVIIAAVSCPYRAIYVKDASTDEELAGYP